MTSHGQIVFDHLVPLFEKSCCAHYKEDFTKHDRHFLSITAVPGMQYLWHVRPAGTTMLVLGAESQIEMLDTILRERDPKDCELYLIKVLQADCSIKRITPEQGRVIAAVKPLVEMVRTRDSRADKPAEYAFRRADQTAATASVVVRRDPEACRTVIDGAIVMPDVADRHTAAVVLQSFNLAARKEAGSLFFGYRDITVNGVSLEAYLEQLTQVRKHGFEASSALLEG